MAKEGARVDYDGGAFAKVFWLMHVYTQLALILKFSCALIHTHTHSHMHSRTHKPEHSLINFSITAVLALVR